MATSLQDYMAVNNITNIVIFDESLVFLELPCSGWSITPNLQKINFTLVVVRILAFLFQQQFKKYMMVTSWHFYMTITISSCRKKKKYIYIYIYIIFIFEKVTSISIKHVYLSVCNYACFMFISSSRPSN